MNLPTISILTTILSSSNLISTFPTNSIEAFSSFAFICLTPDSTVLDYCNANLLSVGLPLKTRTCKNLCRCTLGGSSSLTIQCQPYGCCRSLDVFNACSGHGHCDCYRSQTKRGGELLAANATMAVEDLGGPVPNVCGN